MVLVVDMHNSNANRRGSNLQQADAEAQEWKESQDISCLQTELPVYLYALVDEFLPCHMHSFALFRPKNERVEMRAVQQKVNTDDFPPIPWRLSSDMNASSMVGWRRRESAAYSERTIEVPIGPLQRSHLRVPFEVQQLHRSFLHADTLAESGKMFAKFQH